MFFYHYLQMILETPQTVILKYVVRSRAFLPIFSDLVVGIELCVNLSFAFFCITHFLVQCFPPLEHQIDVFRCVVVLVYDQHRLFMCDSTSKICLFFAWCRSVIRKKAIYFLYFNVTFSEYILPMHKMQEF